jgi:hypothetical protein
LNHRPPMERGRNWIGPEREEQIEDYCYDFWQEMLYDPMTRDRLQDRVYIFQQNHLIFYRPDDHRLLNLQASQAAVYYREIKPPNIEHYRLILGDGVRQHCRVRHGTAHGFVNESLTVLKRACDVRGNYVATQGSLLYPIVPQSWREHPKSEWPFLGPHSEWVRTPDYEGMRVANLIKGYKYCFCIKCTLARVSDVNSNVGVFPQHDQWQMRMFSAFEEHFRTKGQVDGVYMEARALYRLLDMNLDKMLKMPMRSTVCCLFDVLSAFQICVNFDKRIWEAYPQVRNLPIGAIFHVFLTMPLWDMKFYSPSYRCTEF